LARKHKLAQPVLPVRAVHSPLFGESSVPPNGRRWSRHRWPWNGVLL
jgi:hypothetical protein